MKVDVTGANRAIFTKVAVGTKRDFLELKKNR